MVRHQGSHKVYKHPQIQELITLPVHGAGKEPSIGVLNDIKKKAGWK
ncbi:MAG: type II toxin-antitoxin system HicA family toxin [Bacteroidota bacterium]|nr:type II toxin-antitoxin system HicA family toxin [Bacteroidota bacterium]